MLRRGGEADEGIDALGAVHRPRLAPDRAAVAARVKGTGSETIWPAPGKSTTAEAL